MKSSQFFGFIVCLTALTAGSVAPVFAAPVDPTAPAEQPVATLARTAGALEASTVLTQNVFRNEIRQETYTADETFEVNVPVVERYMDDGCHVEKIPMTKVCTEIRHCSAPGVCSAPVLNCGPAVPHLEVCPMGRHCESVFEERRVCFPTPVQRERVVGQRTETRHRQVQKTRPVTVTVFDHQYRLQATVQFPVNATLLGDEQEAIAFRLKGNDATPDADINVQSPVFAYQVEKLLMGNMITFRLTMVPKYKATDLDEETIRRLELVATAGGARLQFEDNGQVARARTLYHLQLIDRTARATVLDKTFAGESPVTAVPVDAAAFTAGHDYVAKLVIFREGIVIDGPVLFSVERPIRPLAQ